MADPEKVTFRAARWSMLAARDLTRIADLDETDVRIFAGAVGAGRFQLLDVLHDGHRKGCIIWTVEEEGEGRSVVINAAACEPIPGVNLTAVIADTFGLIGRQIGASCIRCWTVREGMRRKLERMGATRRYVMEIELNGRQ